MLLRMLGKLVGLGVSLTLVLALGLSQSDGALTIVTWNVRWYREGTVGWFDQKLLELAPEVLCFQEIGEKGMRRFQAEKRGFSQSMTATHGGSRENVTFVHGSVCVTPLAGFYPQSFTHLPEAVYVSYGGFDAVVVNVHLKEGPEEAAREKREREVNQLARLIGDFLERDPRDPDVMVVGDFNAEGDEMKRLVAKFQAQTSSAVGTGNWVLEPHCVPQGTTRRGHMYDYFLLSPDLAGEEALGFSVELSGDAMNWTASDHRPVVGQFRTDAQYRDRPLQ